MAVANPRLATPKAMDPNIGQGSDFAAGNLTRRRIHPVAKLAVTSSAHPSSTGSKRVEYERLLK
jgi:hypothetical protein